jgi:hypothetical protein
LHHHNRHQQEEQNDDDGGNPIFDIFITASNMKSMPESGLLSHEVDGTSLLEYEFTLPK